MSNHAQDDRRRPLRVLPSPLAVGEEPVYCRSCGTFQPAAPDGGPCRACRGWLAEGARRLEATPSAARPRRAC